MENHYEWSEVPTDVLRAVVTRDKKKEGEKWQKQKQKNSPLNPGSKLD